MAKHKYIYRAEKGIIGKVFKPESECYITYDFYEALWDVIYASELSEILEGDKRACLTVYQVPIDFEIEEWDDIHDRDEEDVKDSYQTYDMDDYIDYECCFNWQLEPVKKFSMDEIIDMTNLNRKELRDALFDEEAMRVVEERLGIR